MDGRIKYWTKNAPVRNFGDDLSRFIAENALLSPRLNSDIYHILGSVIDRYIISRQINSLHSDTKSISFWCCGARDDTGIEENQHQYCNFLGVRGPLTCNVLQLPEDTPIGDPGLLLPLIYSPRLAETVHGKSLCIPHFLQTIDPEHFLAIVRSDMALTGEVKPDHEILGPYQNQMIGLERLLAMSGADQALSVGVRSDQDIQDLIDAIVSSEFVLTGALHVAIIACAYGRPFAFWDTGFVDIPFKWQDFAASVGITCEFVRNLDEGRAYYDRVRADIRLPKLVPMLECCPFHVRPDVMRAAQESDARL